MNIAVLTGGGDCPGLNAVIRALTRRSIVEYGCSVMGIQNGWRGLVNADARALTLETVEDILPLGGTILGTSRTNPFGCEGGPESVIENMKRLNIDALVAIGGEDTLGVAARLHKEHGVHLVGVPKTIDNDLSGTDRAVGFDTAVGVATEALDRLRTTAESHNRVMVVEIMGRHAGWITTYAGIAGGADVVLIPEFPLTVEDVCDLVTQRMARGKHFSIVAVSEGAKLTWRCGDEETLLCSEQIDAFGHVRLGGAGTVLAQEIERITGIEARVTILGHVQRGGTPTPSDRVLGTRYGVKAADLVHSGEWGMMVALKGTEIVTVPLADAVSELRTVPLELYETARTFFG
jgi:phosphofructokinase-like protein